MGYEKEKIKQIKGLMLFAALIVLLIIYSGSVLGGVVLFFKILTPFMIGAAIAFILNMPLRFVENKLLKWWKGKLALKLKRPVSLVLALLIVILIITVVIMTVVPQVTKTAVEIGKQIPIFIDGLIKEIEKLAVAYPQIAQQVGKLESLELDWPSLLNSAIDFMKNGMGSVLLNSTVSVASGLIGGVINMLIAVIFAFYVLIQKEKLVNQSDRILHAYASEKVYQQIKRIMTLLHRNFTNFLSGQCLEAVILGSLFVLLLSLLGFPYALLIGVLIAFTALIPIVGAFIGCVVGAFLILMNDPLQALWFIILFLILQQLEGNLIYPRVVGSSVGLPSMWVLVAVSLGGSMFGVVGMLVFIPLVSTAYSLLRESVNDRNSMKVAVRTGGGGSAGSAEAVPEKEAENASSGEGRASDVPVNGKNGGHLKK